MSFMGGFKKKIVTEKGRLAGDAQRVDLDGYVRRETGQNKRSRQDGIKLRVEMEYMSNGEKAARLLFDKINKEEYNGMFSEVHFNSWIEEFNKGMDKNYGEDR